MNIVIEGFGESMTDLLKTKCEEAMNEGLEAFKLWALIVDIKADLSIEGNNIVIRKEV